MPDSLNTLANAAMGGDADAWHDLYSAITPGLFSLLQSKISRTEVEEVVLITWEKVFLKLPTFNPAYSFRTWVFTIAMNTFRDHLRRARHDLTPIGDLSWCDERALLSRDDEDLQQQLEHLAICRDSLDPLERKIVRLRYWEGKSHTEIAELLGLRTSQIRAKCHRTVRKLATCMGY